MEMISENVVARTWQEVAGFSPAQAEKEMQQMGRNQPELLAFLMAMTEDMDEEAKELAIYIAFVVYRIFQSSRAKMKKITSKEILRCYEANEELVGTIEEAQGDFIERLAGTQISRQPHVVQYVLDALFEEPEEGESSELTDEEKGSLFLLLKTEIDLLDKAGKVPEEKRHAAD